MQRDESGWEGRGSGRELTDALTISRTRQLVAEIGAIDPNYRFDSFGLPQTLEGQNRQLEQLQQDRAAAIYRVRGDLRPLQVETLRFVRQRVDIAYNEGMRRLRAGTLNINLSPDEAVGNFVDQTVRQDVRNLYGRLRIATVKGEQVRVIGASTIRWALTAPTVSLTLGSGTSLLIGL